MVGAVALAATGVGAAASAGLIGTGIGSTAMVAGISAATLTTVGALAGVAAGVLSFAASATAKGPSVAGDQTEWTANKDQGIPWVTGRTSVSGWIISRQTWDYGGSKDNAYQTFVAVRSGMPTYQVESFSIDGVPITFAGDAAVGSYAGFMWLNQQHGAMPEASALPGASFKPTYPGWDATSKLSGCDAYSLTLKWDDKGKKFPSGPPEPTTVLKGAMVWDPRKDSTYPGGSGSHRPNDPTTWEFTESGPLLALAWARGLYQNAKRVMGIGFALTSINVAQFVEAANVAQANEWTCGGVVYSTDSKWEVLKKFLATASAEPLKLAGSLGCAVDTPRVPLATITTADIIGDWSVTATPSSRDRFNGVIPKYRSEDHGWELVDADVVRIPDYVDEDGREVTRALTWELVQDVDQVAELALYQICNAREFGPIVVPLKIKWIGYRPGDCLRITSPELGMDSQDVVITRRHLDPLSGAVTLTMRSETAAKHAFALGETGTPPPTPSLQVVDREQLLIPGYSAGWTGVIDDDPIAHPKPQDGATKGAPFGTLVYEREAQQVIADLDSNAATILLTAFRGLSLRDYVDTKLFVDGVPVNAVVSQEIERRVDGQNALASILSFVGAMNPLGDAFVLNMATAQVDEDGRTLGQVISVIDANDNTISEMRQVLVDPAGGATAKVVLSMDVNGHVSGWDATNNGEIAQLAFAFDRYLFLRPDGSPLIYNVGGVVKIPNVEVDTLKVNAAMVPVRLASATGIAGTETNPAATPTPATAMSATIEIVKAGWIEVFFAAQQGYSANGAYQARITVDGMELAESVRGGGSGDKDNNFLSMGAIRKTAGTYAIAGQCNGCTGLTLNQRVLWIKHFPDTE